MEGASALQSVLQDVPEKALRVFVVWEPVLLTDIAPPTSRVLSRIADRRVVQLYDRNRRLSGEIVRSILAEPSRRPHGEGFDTKTIVWDFVAVFEPGQRWEAVFPSPGYQGYPVADVIDEVRRRLVAPERQGVEP